MAFADSLPPQNRKQYIAGQLQAWRILRLYCQFTHPPKEKFLLLTLRQHMVPLHPPLPGERERPEARPRATRARLDQDDHHLRPGHQGGQVRSGQCPGQGLPQLATEREKWCELAQAAAGQQLLPGGGEGELLTGFPARPDSSARHPSLTSADSPADQGRRGSSRVLNVARPESGNRRLPPEPPIDTA